MHALRHEGRRLNPWWLIPGSIVAAVGAVFVLDAAGVLKANETIDRWWPVAMIILAVGVVAFGLVGLFGLAEVRASIIVGPLLVAAGVVLLLFTTHTLEKSAWTYVWAALVLLAGLIIASRAFERARFESAWEQGAVRHGAFRVRGRLLLVRATDKIGAAVEWLCTGGRPALLMLILAAAGFIWWNRWGALLAYAALLLAWFAAKAKTRVVIETFEDHTTSSAAAEEPRSGAAVDSRDSAAATGDRSDPHPLDVSGIAGLLATKLAEMRNVYQLLEEPLGRPRPGPVEGAVQLEDIGDVLRSAFTTQSHVSVGPITLPFGGVMALLSRLMQAPRLRGAIHGSNSHLTLTAHLTMRGHDYVWSVSTPPLEVQTALDARQQMVAELAYRVFTDLSLRGAAEWPATRYWLDALTERQACQRSPRDRRYHLEIAESHLRNALAEDERFYLAAYNLGIVYRDLAKEDEKRKRAALSNPEHVPADGLRGVRDEPYTRSALRTFKYAIDQLDRGRWEAYYGLALSDWKLAGGSVGDAERRLDRVIDDCDRALDLASGRAASAQIQDLKARAQSDLARLVGRSEAEALADAQMAQTGVAEAQTAQELARARAEELSNAALETWNRACRSILRELILTQLWRVPGNDLHLTRLRKEAARCLLNLAIAYDEVEKPDIAEHPKNPLQRWRRNRRFARIGALTSAAVRLADVDATAHEQFARIALRWGDFETAQAELRHALRIDQDNPMYWALLAKASAENAKEAAKRAENGPKKARDAANMADYAAREACGRAEREVDFGLLLNATAEQNPEDNPEEIYKLLGEAYRSLDGDQAVVLESRQNLRVQIASVLEPKPKQREDTGARAFRVCGDLARLLCDYHKDDWEAAIVERHLGQQLLESSFAIAKYIVSDARSGQREAQLDELRSVCERGGPPKQKENGAVGSLVRAREAAHRLGAPAPHLVGAPPDKRIEEVLAQSAEDVFADAIKRLTDSDHESDIRRWGLLGGKARAIVRQPDRTGEALPLAERGVAIDPLSPAAWRALAVVLEHGGDYRQACTAWSRAELIDPEDPDSRVLFSLCQWQYAMWTTDDARRRNLLREAMGNLHKAGVLYDVAQMERRRRAEWWAAKCHWMLGEFTEMPSHLRFILASLEQQNPPPEDKALQALVELMLAQSYRQTRHFADAEDYARRAMNDADSLRRRHSGRRQLPREYLPADRLRDDEWSLGAIQILARAELAGCHADRNSPRGRDAARCHRAELLMDGRKALQSAEMVIDRVKTVQPTNKQETERLRSELLTERGRIELARGHPRKAAKLLTRATRENPGSAGSYVSLAGAYERLAAKRWNVDATRALGKARDSCELAKTIVGPPHLQWEAADEIEQRLPQG
jgi:hypothetical protein